MFLSKAAKEEEHPNKMLYQLIARSRDKIQQTVRAQKILIFFTENIIVPKRSNLEYPCDVTKGFQMLNNIRNGLKIRITNTRKPKKIRKIH